MLCVCVNGAIPSTGGYQDVGWLGRLDIPARYRNSAPQSLTAVVVGLLLALATGLLRLALQQVWPTTIPFGLVFPAILLATLFGRWQAGLTTFVSAGLFTWYFLVQPTHSFRVATADQAALLFLYSVVGLSMLAIAEAYRQAERRLAREQALRAQADARRQQMVTTELNHRIKNLLTVVQSIAGQTLGKSADRSAWTSFEKRLAALARSHDLLVAESGDSASLHDLVQAALAPFDDGRRFRLEGPPVQLPSRKTVSICLGLHELATNAVKYGALAVQNGCVDVIWRVDEGHLHLLWTESGGPLVEMPTRCGFGTRLLERGIAAELKGHVKVDYRPEGLQCEIAAPLDAAR